MKELKQVMASRNVKSTTDNEGNLIHKRFEIISGDVTPQTVDARKTNMEWLERCVNGNCKHRHTPEEILKEAIRNCNDYKIFENTNDFAKAKCGMDIITPLDFSSCLEIRLYIRFYNSEEKRVFAGVFDFKTKIQ